MTSRDFCYWLQGYFELSKPQGREGLSPSQLEMIERHLAMVFKHEIDPSMGDSGVQSALDAIHEAVPPPPSGDWLDAIHEAGPPHPSGDWALQRAEEHSPNSIPHW